MDTKAMMKMIVYTWDQSIFYNGGSLSYAGYTDEQYKLLGYTSEPYKEIESMNNIRLQRDEFFDDFDDFEPQGFNNIGKGLTIEDKSILIDNSNIFEDLKSEAFALKCMLGLALRLNRYRYLCTKNETSRKLLNRTRNKLNKSKKSYKVQEENLKKKAIKLKETMESFTKAADDIITLMGGTSISHGEVSDRLNKSKKYLSNSGELIKQLEIVIKYPNAYILKSYKPITTSKEDIKDYLKKLNLKGKSCEIKNFIRDINNVEIKQ